MQKILKTKVLVVLFLGILTLQMSPNAQGQITAEPPSESGRGVVAHETNPLPNLPFTVNEALFQPRFQTGEESQGGLNSVVWQLGALGRLNTWIDLQLAVGASVVLFRPFWVPKLSETVTATTAKGTLHTDFGDIYGGQFQVPWGLEGTLPAYQLWLPRSLFYEKGLFPLFDQGIGYYTEYNGFYLHAAIHNGEGADTPNTDNRMFVTSQIGYMGPAHVKTGISGTTGRIGGSELGVENRVAGGNVFFGFNIFGLGLQLEGSFLDYASDPINTDKLAWHCDGQAPINDHINLIARFEQINQDLYNSGDIQTRAYLGGEYHSLDNESRLFLFYQRNRDAQNSSPNDMALLIWRIHPSGG